MKSEESSITPGKDRLPNLGKAALGLNASAIPAFRLLGFRPPAGQGIACAGNWVVDRTKLIDRYPEENSLAMILEETIGGGGCAYNVIIDLARFDPGLRLTASGLIGNDENGDYILRDCSQYPNIDLRYLKRVSTSNTAYTDAYTVGGGRSRTFFSSLGCNRLFDASGCDLREGEAWLVHLGYLMLLESLDQPDPEYGRVSARLLAALKAKGFYTSVDLVSIVRSDFPEVVFPALDFADILFANDFETEELTGTPLRPGNLPSTSRLRSAASQLLEGSRLSLVVVHFPEGVYAATRSGVELLQPSLAIPTDEIRGTAGAGDAFCAGFLYGLYAGYTLAATARFAVSAGAMNLFDLTTTHAIGSAGEVAAMKERFPFRALESCFTT